MFRTLVLVLLCAVALTAASPIQREQTQKASVTTSSHQPAQTDQRGTERAPLIVNVQKTPQTEKEAAQDESDRRERISTDNWIIRLTLALAVIGVLQTAVFGIQSWLLKRTIDETRRIGEAEVRAYLSCEKATYMIVYSALYVWPEIRNTGQSPAKNIRIEAALTAWENDGGQATRLPEESGSTIVPPIPAGKTDNGMLVFTGMGLKPTDPASDPQNTFRLRCLMSWDDVFDRANTIAFDLLETVTADIVGEDDKRRREGVMKPFHKTPLTKAELEADDWLFDEADKDRES